MLRPIDGFYLALGQLTASLLYTLLLLGLVVLTAYVCARVEIRQERRRNQSRKEPRK